MSQEHERTIESVNQVESESPTGVAGFIQSLPAWTWVGCMGLVVVCCAGALGIMAAFGLKTLFENASIDIESIEVDNQPDVVVGEDAPEDVWGSVVVGRREPVRLAVNTVTSGAGVDVYGLTELRGAELAAADFGWQVAGHDIEIVPQDTRCHAEGGQSAAQATAADETIVAAVVGHTCSSSCAPAANIYEAAHLTMVSPSCTSGVLTEEDMPRAFMRTGYNDNFQAYAAADFVYYELGLTTAATIHDGSPYSKGLVTTFADAFEALGGTVVAAEEVDVGTVDMRPLLTSIAAVGPDLIYFPVFPAEGGFIAAQSGEIQGLGNVVLMGADGIKSNTFIESAGDGAEGVYASGPAPIANPAYEDFLEAYLDAYDEEPPAPFAPESYDAMTLILRAIEAVAVEDNKGNLVIGRYALREAMYNSNFEGVTGTIACNEFGDCGAVRTEIYQVVNGEFVAVDQ